MSFTSRSHSGSAAARVELFRRSRRWFGGIVLLTGLAIGGGLTDLFLRSRCQYEAAALKVAELGLSWTALAPAGTAFIRPELHHSGVDLRFIPQLTTATQSTGWFETAAAPMIASSPHRSP